MTLHVPVGHDMFQFTHAHVSNDFTTFFSSSLHFFRLSHCMLRFVAPRVSVCVKGHINWCQCRFHSMSVHVSVCHLKFQSTWKHI